METVHQARFFRAVQWGMVVFRASYPTQPLPASSRENCVCFFKLNNICIFVMKGYQWQQVGNLSRDYSTQKDTSM